MQPRNRNQYANDLSTAILDFMNIHYGFSMDCITTSNEDFLINSGNAIINRADILGRDSDVNRNVLLLYLNEDGIVEKRIIIE